MDTTELTSVLEDAGLSPYQVEAYVTVLERGAAPATEIAERSDVPGPRIYDVLRALEERGYVETYEQDTLRVRAHSPENALSDLEHRAERFSRAATEIEERWEQPPLDSHAASIVGRFETVLDRARNVIRTADHQIQLAVTSAQFKSLESALRVAHENGVNTRLSLNTGPDGAEELPTEAALARACTEARHRPMPSPFLAIVDRTRVCFAPHTHSANQYGVLVDDRTHAYVFHWYFLSGLWEIFEPIHSARPPSPPISYVDIRECIRDIEPLLTEGAVVTARIEGRDTETGEEYELRGSVVDTFYMGETTGEKASLVQLAGRATLTLDTGDREYTVGGWGAIVEPIEATTITVESFDPAR